MVWYGTAGNSHCFGYGEVKLKRSRSNQRGIQAVNSRGIVTSSSWNVADGSKAPILSELPRRRLLKALPTKPIARSMGSQSLDPVWNEKAPILFPYAEVTSSHHLCAIENCPKIGYRSFLVWVRVEMHGNDAFPANNFSARFPRSTRIGESS